ncbi:MAG: hypothetical protein JO354_06045 [Verrucomicrobia bacterium]|nr:hypothetical protein [Verrucomicrobiota bacterium]
MPAETNYSRIIAYIFAKHHKQGVTEITFDREEIVEAAEQLKLPRPKNVGDVVYSFRSRKAFPESIRNTAIGDLQWVLRKAGPSKYRFVLAKQWSITPDPHFTAIKIPDATPGIIARYALDDEQALLAVLATIV